MANMLMLPTLTAPVLGLPSTLVVDFVGLVLMGACYVCHTNTFHHIIFTVSHSDYILLHLVCCNQGQTIRKIRAQWSLNRSEHINY